MGDEVRRKAAERLKTVGGAIVLTGKEIASVLQDHLDNGTLADSNAAHLAVIAAAEHLLRSDEAIKRAIREMDDDT